MECKYSEDIMHSQCILSITMNGLVLATNLLYFDHSLRFAILFSKLNRAPNFNILKSSLKQLDINHFEALGNKICI